MTKQATAAELEPEIDRLHEDNVSLRAMLLRLIPWVDVNGAKRCVMCNAIWMHEAHKPECLWVGK